MEIVTSWMEQGLQQGKTQGQKEMMVRFLKKHFEMLSENVENNVQALPAKNKYLSGNIV